MIPATGITVTAGIETMAEVITTTNIAVEMATILTENKKSGYPVIGNMFENTAAERLRFGLTGTTSGEKSKCGSQDDTAEMGVINTGVNHYTESDQESSYENSPSDVCKN